MTTPFRDILLKLCRREDLTRDEAREAFLHVMSGEASDAQIAALLMGLGEATHAPVLISVSIPSRPRRDLTLLVAG